MFLRKYVLKKIAEKYIPYNQIYRDKIGFSTPINSWINDNNNFGKYVSILKEEKTLNRNFIKRKGVLNLLNSFENNKDSFKYSLAGRIWILLNLEIWIRTFIEEKKELIF